MKLNKPKNTTSILIDTGKNKLRTDLLYDIGIEHAHICFLTNSLQVVFSLKNDFYNNKEYVLVDYPINSTKFYTLLNNIYPADWGEIIEVDPNDFDSFFAQGKIEYDGDTVDIDFNSIELYCSARNKLHHKLFCL